MQTAQANPQTANPESPASPSQSRNKGGNGGRGSKWIRPEKRLRLYSRDRFSCVYCGASGVSLTLDHVLPRELGGDNKETNLVTACLSCNSRKGKMTVRGFLSWLRNRGMEANGVSRRIRNALKRRLPKGGEK